MDGSDKVISSSTPINKPSQTLINDENEKIREEMDPISRNQKTPATLRKKKILAENNQTNTSKLETSQESLSQKTPFQTQIAEFDENDQNNALAADSDSKPYDPMTNYLLPRPKFLRYQPSRRREILLRKENEGSSIISTRSFSESKSDIGEEEDAPIDALEGPIGNLKLEDEWFDESDDDFEEINEVRRWGLLTGLLKFFLVIAALVFCTSCVYNMNSNSPSFSAQAVRSLENKYYLIQHNVYELAKSFQDWRQLVNGENADDFSGIVESQSESLEIFKAEMNRQVDELDEVIEPIQSGEIEAIEADFGEIGAIEADVGEIEAIQANVGENADDFSGIVESQSESLEIFKAEMNRQVDELDEVIEPIQSGEIEAIEADFGEIGAIEADVGEIEAIEADVGEIEAIEADVGENKEEVLEQPAEKIDQNFDNEMAIIDQVFDNESLQKSQVAIIPDGISNEGISNEVNSLETDCDAEGNPEIKLVMEPIHGVETDRTEDEIDGTDIVNPESMPSLIDIAGSELYIKAVIAVLASLVFGLRFMKKKRVHNDSSKKILKPCAKKSVMITEEKKIILEDSMIEVPVTKPNSISTLPHDEHKENNYNSSDYFSKSRLMIEEEDSSESYKSHAPAVEFLGEFVIGEVSSSMRSRVIKSEVNSHSVSEEKAQSMSYHSQQPALSESSNIVSPSHGSFTAEKKTSKKKKESRDGDNAGITTTPLRRSNRLQSRAIAFPISMKGSSSLR